MSLLGDHRFGQARYRVAVLLSAYGNSPYFRQQLESLRLAMTAEDILIVVDDGSGAVTWEALSNWPTDYLCWSRLKGLGSAVSFWELLIDVPELACYYCWADQDDLWLADKLGRQIEAISTSQTAWASVHGWRILRQNLHHVWVADRTQAPLNQLSPAHYCFETPAPGMTLCVSENGRQLLRSLDAEFCGRLLKAMPHDRLACAILGVHDRMTLVSQPLVDYRQHRNNQIGAPRAAFAERFLNRLVRISRTWHSIQAGLILYGRLATDSAVIGRELPPLAGQNLRSRGWESRVIQLFLRWRNVVNAWKDSSGSGRNPGSRH